VLVRIGTRSSALAMVQTRRVIEKMKTVMPNFEPEIKAIKTSGDAKQKITGSGAFVNEINMAILQGKVDIGVHSLKDLPASLPRGLLIACVPERLSPNDALLSRGGSDLYRLPSGAVIGTSCPRRVAEIRHLRHDLKFGVIRGNIETRIKKMQDGCYDAIVVALAALERLGREGLISQRFELEEVVPAPGQGALAVVCKKDYKWGNVLAEINDERAWLETICERTFIEKLKTGCMSSTGAVARADGRKIKLTAVIHHKGRILRYFEGKEPRRLGKIAAKTMAGVLNAI